MSENVWNKQVWRARKSAKCSKLGFYRNFVVARYVISNIFQHIFWKHAPSTQTVAKRQLLKHTVSKSSALASVMSVNRSSLSTGARSILCSHTCEVHGIQLILALHSNARAIGGSVHSEKVDWTNVLLLYQVRLYFKITASLVISHLRIHIHPSSQHPSLHLRQHHSRCSLSQHQ